MKLSKIVLALASLMVAGSVAAKLPPPSDDAKAKAAQAKDKGDWSNKVANYQLCMSQDKVVARYNKSKPAKPGSTAAAPGCQNPGPYVATVAAPPAAAAMPVTAAAPAAMAPAAAKK